MWRVTSRNKNKKSIKERGKKLDKSIEKKNQEDPFEFTRLDVIAMIIAAFQILLPILLLGIAILALFTFLFTKFFLK